LSRAGLHHRTARIRGDSFCARGNGICDRQSPALEFQGWLGHTHQIQGCHGLISSREAGRRIEICLFDELLPPLTQTHRRYESLPGHRCAWHRSGRPRRSSATPRGSFKTWSLAKTHPAARAHKRWCYCAAFQNRPVPDQQALQLVHQAQALLNSVQNLANNPNWAETSSLVRARRG